MHTSSSWIRLNSKSAYVVLTILSVVIWTGAVSGRPQESVHVVYSETKLGGVPAAPEPRSGVAYVYSIPLSQATQYYDNGGENLISSVETEQGDGEVESAGSRSPHVTSTVSPRVTAANRTTL